METRWGDLASWRRFSSLFRSLLRFTPRPVPHVRVTFGQLGKYCRELRHEIAKSSSTLALSPPPSSLPSAHSRDNKLARLGSAGKPRFYLAMDRNEHLWREAKRGGNVYANCDLGISPEISFSFSFSFLGNTSSFIECKRINEKIFTLIYNFCRKIIIIMVFYRNNRMENIYKFYNFKF